MAKKIKACAWIILCSVFKLTYVFLWGGGSAHGTAHLWRSEDSLDVLILASLPCLRLGLFASRP